jgi:flagellar protein FliS
MNAIDQARRRYHDDGLKTVSPQRLVTMLFDRLLRDLDDATDAIAARRIEAAHIALIHAQDIVLELHLALDPDGFEGGQSLADIYVYLADRLVTANQTKSPDVVAECRSLVEPIAEAFRQVAQMPQRSSEGALAGAAFGSNTTRA